MMRGGDGSGLAVPIGLCAVAAMAACGPRLPTVDQSTARVREETAPIRSAGGGVAISAADMGWMDPNQSVVMAPGTQGAIAAPTQDLADAFEQTILENQASLCACTAQSSRAGEPSLSELPFVIRIRPDGSVAALSVPTAVSEQAPVLWGCAGEMLKRWIWPQLTLAEPLQATLTIRLDRLQTAEADYRAAVDAIRAEAIAHLPGIVDCWTRNGGGAAVSGKRIVLLLFVDPDGAVNPAIAASEEINLPDPRKCALEAIRTWQLPAPRRWNQGRVTAQVEVAFP
jgi:hypothetical protein